MPFLTVQESGGICFQPSRVWPWKIGVRLGGSGACGAGMAAMLAMDSWVVGAVAGGFGAPDDRCEIASDTNTAAMRNVRCMAANLTATRAEPRVNLRATDSSSMAVSAMGGTPMLLGLRTN